MGGVSESYMKDKLKRLNPSWNPVTIDSWKGEQLRRVYVRVQQEVLAEIIASVS